MKGQTNLLREDQEKYGKVYGSFEWTDVMLIFLPMPLAVAWVFTWTFILLLVFFLLLFLLHTSKFCVSLRYRKRCGGRGMGPLLSMRSCWFHV